MYTVLKKWIINVYYLQSQTLRGPLQIIAYASAHCQVNPSVPDSHFRTILAATGSPGRGVNHAWDDVHMNQWKDKR